MTGLNIIVIIITTNPHLLIQQLCLFQNSVTLNKVSVQVF